MAEVIAMIGLTASILTLIDRASKALEFAKALHKAPGEMTSLQHELASFQQAIQSITEFQGDQELLNSIVENELSRSRVVVQKLQTFIDTSLLRKGLPSRRRWAKKVGRMNQLREDLRVTRNQLVLGLSVSNSASLSKAAAQLNKITHQLSTSHNSAERIEKSLQNISCQNSLTQEIALRSANMARDTKDAILFTTRSLSKPWDGKEEPGLMIGSYGSRNVAVGPNSAFEQSPSFFPAQYTISTRISKVRALAMFEKSCSAVQRVNEYHIIFSISPQRWLSIVLSVSTPRRSTYWSPFKLNTSRAVIAQFLPKPLERLLGKLLSRLDDYGDQVQMSFEFSEEDNPEKCCPSITPMLAAPGQELLDFVRDLGCPLYPEKAVSPLSNYGSPRGSHGIVAFVSGLPNGQICREEKLLAQAVYVEETKWKLRLYQCLENCIHVPRLLGVVTDNSYRYVKSILTNTAGDLTPTPLFRLINNFTKKAQGSTQRVALNRRLLWARQIVTGLRDLHQKGFVIGQMELFAFGATSRNIIQILSYREKGRLLNFRCPYIAPELRHLSQGAEVLFTSRTDLFQLGLVLWLIGQHQHISEVQPPLCRCGCVEASEANDNGQHTAAIELPPMDDCIPDWYVKVVEVCRYEEPQNRWTASELLSLFPWPEASPLEDTLALDQTWDRITLCEVCDKRVFLSYTCNACKRLGFDLCSECFNAGAHCAGEDHLLEEVIYDKDIVGWKPVGRHYSKPNPDSGQRHMLYLE